MKFDYGDEVLATQIGTEGQRLDRVCSVVAITPVDTEDKARTFGYPIGTTLHTVEFGDGSDALLSEDALQPTRKKI